MNDTIISRKPLRIAFIHPDLGIGGAERLVVDAAIGLQEKGHEVIIYTSHCDKSHCFEEIKNNTLRVKVYGDELPTNLMGKLFIFFATLRQMYLTLSLVLTGQINNYDLFVVDQLSTCVPFLRYLSRNSKVLFYCHFPDQLLAKRTSLIKKLYRVPFDFIEQITMGAANGTVVNSKFTRSVFKRTFKLLSQTPNVVYPCVDLEPQTIDQIDEDIVQRLLPEKDHFYLSINRYEKKKNIELAIKSFSLSKERDNEHAKLVIVGGYDERVVENKKSLEELKKLADELKLSNVILHYSECVKDLNGITAEATLNPKVIFLTSISSSLKELLLQRTRLLLYTPSYEHFGIVPLEAMKLGKPVLAVKNGGPLETVVSLSPGKNEDTSTGWLRDALAEEWASAIDESIPYLERTPTIFESNGPLRVKAKFSRKAMTQELENNIEQMSLESRNEAIIQGAIGFFFKTTVSAVISLIPYLFFGSKIWSLLLLVLLSLKLVRE